MELRTINFDDKHFECGGRKFYVRDSLSFARYKVLQELNLEFGFSANFHDIFKQLRIAWDHLNSLRLGEAAVTIHNIMYGVISLDEKDDPALRMCALFIDEEGEDPTKYDEGKMREKIQCWGEELDVSPFFQLAANLCPEWIPAYKLVSQSISEKGTGKQGQSQS
jgi:hypothetical protein